MFVGLLRTTQYAFRNISRNWWLSIVTVFLLVLTTFSITLVAGLNVVGQRIIDTVEDKVNIDFYFHSYVAEEDILDAQAFLKQMEEVNEVLYISQANALERFKEDNADNAVLIASLNELDENPLPASLVVTADKVAEYPVILERLNQSAFVDLIDDTDYGESESVISRLSSTIETTYQVGMGVSAIFVIISIIVILNTIRMTIYNHREEVGIMKLVGATNWFIRGPFLLEGLLLGLIAALITLSLFYAILYISDPAITSYFEGYNFSVWPYFVEQLPIIGLMVVAGTSLLSSVSSMVAITRHLKV